MANDDPDGVQRQQVAERTFWGQGQQSNKDWHCTHDTAHWGQERQDNAGRYNREHNR